MKKVGLLRYTRKILEGRQHHIIHSLSYDVQFADLAEHNPQLLISRLHHQKLSLILETVFDKISDPKEYIQLNHLEVDLHEIAKENWAQNLEHKLESMLIPRLEESIAAARHVSQESSVKQKEPEIRFLTLAQKQRESFLYFLETGLLKWMTYPSDQSVNEIFTKAFMQKPLESSHALTELLKKSKTALSRFIHQVNTDLQIDWLKSTFPGKDGLISSLFQFIDTITEKPGLQDPGIQRMSFGLISRLYRFLFNGDNSEITSESFVNTISGEFRSGFSKDISMLKDTARRSIKKKYGDEFDSLINPDYKPLESEDPTDKSEIKEKVNQAVEEATFEHGILAPNAGLILLHPYLHALYTLLGLLKDNAFIDQDKRTQAVFILHYMATEKEEAEEPELLVPKIVCGFDLIESLPRTIVLEKDIRKECNHLLKTMIKNWSVLKSTSPDGLRESFLQRQAIIKMENKEWHFYMEGKSIDVLLDRLPYHRSLIKLKWLNQMIHVSW